jgi:hypothetical protein
MTNGSHVFILALYKGFASCASNYMTNSSHHAKALLGAIFSQNMTNMTTFSIN